MKRKLLLLLVVSVVVSLVIGLAGCKGETPTTPTPSTPTPTTPTPTTPTPTATPEATYKWIAQGHWDSGHGHNQLVLKEAQLIEERTGGQIQIEYHYAGEIVPAYEVYDATGKGLLDCGWSCPCYSAQQVPGSAVFCACPSYLSPAVKIMWELDGGGLALEQEIIGDAFGIRLLPGLPLINEVFAYSRVPITDVASLQAIKMRSAGTRAAIFAEAGVSVVSIPGPEIVPSMEKGVVDACEYADAWGDANAGFLDVSDYLYLTQNPMGALMSFMVNNDKWNELTPELQDEVTSACIDARQLFLANLIRYNMETWKEAEDKGQVEVLLLPDAVAAHMNAAAKSYFAKARTNDAIMDRILTAMEAYEAKYQKYEPIMAANVFNVSGKY